MHAEEKTRLVFMPRTRLCFIDLDLKEFLSRECLYIYIYIYMEVKNKTPWAFCSIWNAKLVVVVVKTM